MAVFSAVRATGTVTRAATTDLLADGDTLTIGAITYRFKTTTAQANDIFLSGSSDAATAAAFASLAAVLNGTATIAASGADAYTGTVNGHTDVKGSVSADGLVLTLTARAYGTVGNYIPLSEVIVDAQITVSGAALAGGTGDGNANLRTYLAAVQARVQLNSQAISEIDALQDELV